MINCEMMIFPNWKSGILNIGFSPFKRCFSSNFEIASYSEIRRYDRIFSASWSVFFIMVICAILKQSWTYSCLKQALSRWVHMTIAFFSTYWFWAFLIGGISHCLIQHWNLFSIFQINSNYTSLSNKLFFNNSVEFWFISLSTRLFSFI